MQLQLLFPDVRLYGQLWWQPRVSVQLLRRVQRLQEFVQQPDELLHGELLFQEVSVL